MKILITLLLILSNFSALYSQENRLNHLELEKRKTYYNLDEAVAKPDDVYKLFLTKKKLKKFPMEILVFKNLQVLNISGNKITEIPLEIDNLKNLQVLNISKNKLKKLPNSFGNLHNLESLYMSDNHILYFPNELRGLDKLQVFDVIRNHLTEHEIQFLKEILPSTCDFKH